MARTKRTPEQAREAREAKLGAAHEQISDYITNLTSGDDWKRWLDVSRRFPSYSFNNRVLIAQQMPEATSCMGYRAWQAIGRQVRRGETGLTILGPRMAITGWREADGSVTHSNGTISKNDIPAGATPVRSMVGAVPLKTFDVSQTDGEPLPENPVPDPVALDGPAPDGMRDGLAQLIAEHGFTLTHEPARRGEDGFTDFRTHTVNISPGQSGAQEALTLAHEVGHMLLHDPEQRSPDEPRQHRGLAEVEAESVAYLIAGHYGYDTADNSFPYVAGWARGDTDLVRATAERVVTTADTVLTKLDPEVGQEPEQAVEPDLARRATATRDTAAELAPADDKPAAATAPVRQESAEPAPDTGPAEPVQLALLATPGAADSPTAHRESASASAHAWSGHHTAHHRDRQR